MITITKDLRFQPEKTECGSVSTSSFRFQSLSLWETTFKALIYTQHGDSGGCFMLVKKNGEKRSGRRRLKPEVI